MRNWVNVMGAGVPVNDSVIGDDERSALLSMLIVDTLCVMLSSVEYNFREIEGASGSNATKCLSN